MTLRPDETVQKALISTPSRFVGEFEADGVLLTHAWPAFHDREASLRWQEGPASRSTYILAFKTKATEKRAGTPVPDYSAIGEIVASYLSVLFGKRFDSHGLVEGSGMYHVPQLSLFGTLINPSLPQNSHTPRADFDVPLNLTETARITPLLLGHSLPMSFANTFRGAAKFYWQALQNFEREPEIAYLHLISAGEIISNFHKYEKSSLLDETTKSYLTDIRKNLDNGDKISRHIESRLLLIKRRFVETIVQLIDADFFERSEAAEDIGRFKLDNFERVISAAYDLRSKYVHTGAPFGSWVILQMGGRNTEVQVGKPIISDSDLAKILEHAPTLAGLERVIRYCLLQFALHHGALVDSPSNAVNA